MNLLKRFLIFLALLAFVALFSAKQPQEKRSNDDIAPCLNCDDVSGNPAASQNCVVEK